jgi:GT2 family glycosyltransferase
MPEAPCPDRKALAVSVVIPTFRRGKILLDTLRALLKVGGPLREIIVVDQTPEHPSEVGSALLAMEREGAVQILHRSRPSIPDAMNAGLLAARGDLVLFLDDDIVPCADLAQRHADAYERHPEAWAVAGQVLQPEDGDRKTEDGGQKTEVSDQGSEDRRQKREDRCRRAERGGLRKGLDFKFNGDSPAWVENGMAGNLSIRRERALALGGFDGNFVPPVSYRFETEFAKRLVSAGGRIYFEPLASIRHLRAGGGGTRSLGSHLTSGSPLHGVGDYYYALLRGNGLDRARYILRRPFREVCTRFHLRHPWWIPVKGIGEIRALAMSWRLYRGGPRLLAKEGK